MIRNRFLLLLTGLLLFPAPRSQAQTPGNEAAILRTGIPNILPLRERGEVVNRWLVKRLDTILPEIMRREGFDMWIVDNREYNEDPVFFSLMPGNTMAARRRTILVFHDPGPGQPIERLAVSRYGIGNFYRGMWNPEEEPDQYRALAKVIEERDPDEIRIINGEYVTVPDAKVYNPAFDMTPPELVDAIITDRGVVKNPTEEKMRKLFESD